MAKITISLSTQVEAGPQINSSFTLEVHAYDYIDQVVEAGQEISIDLQPSANKNLKFLLIQASGNFDKGNFTYGVTNAEQIILDGSHLYQEGSIALLGNEVKIIKFKNKETAGSKKDAKLKILVGRDPNS